VVGASCGLLAIAPWIYYSQLPSWLVLFVGICGIAGLATSALTFYLFHKQQEANDP
jgi:hypothetical protein